MAGSKKRLNVQGHVVMGDEEQIKKLRRLASGELTQIFLQAKEQGQTRVNLDDEQFTLHRHPDHTFSLEPGVFGHVIF